MRKPVFWPLRGWLAWASTPRVVFLMRMLERFVGGMSRARSGERMLSWGPLRAGDKAFVLAFRARRAAERGGT